MGNRRKEKIREALLGWKALKEDRRKFRTVVGIIAKARGISRTEARMILNSNLRRENAQ